jgi:thiosulfate/3-mercaptopyruvate sulfurtransferase
VGRYETIVDADTLYGELENPDWVVVDCRFYLADTAAGEREYLSGHIPGAVYAHLDRDLSSEPVSDTGRHPLPAPAAMIELFSRLGIDKQKQVVAYDSAVAAGLGAARLWWMLRYLGHTAVAVLDGGWPAWVAAGRPQKSGVESNAPANFEGKPHRHWLVLLDEVAGAGLLVDSRESPRYRGEVEPIDPVAGHIPGAVNHPLSRNVDSDGRFLPPEILRQQLLTVLGATPPEEAVFYCGSGVSACANLLAMRIAGLPDGRLYAGSWSEWCQDPERTANL